jgi:hypothetical protein
MALLLNRPPPRKVRPVSGTCHWALPIGAAGTGVLAISQVCYSITILKNRGCTIGYRLEKLDGTVYDMNTESEPWTCDCPYATYRERECKHVKALRADLARTAVEK